MSKGEIYPSERVIFQDPRSGLRVIRLTHGPCIASNLYFEMCSFTEDDRYVVFRSQRYAGRDAPWDLFRATTDGKELVQLTDHDTMNGIVFCPKTHAFYFTIQREIRKLDILTMKEEPIAEAPGPPPKENGTLASIDAEGQLYISNCRIGEHGSLLYKLDIPSRKITVLHEGCSQNHIDIDPTGHIISFNEITRNFQTGEITDATPFYISVEGGTPTPYGFQRFAHRSWLGNTGTIQGTLLPPEAGIAILTPGASDVDICAQGRYYWHSGASRDGEWIVADTNWPQEGIYLLHVPTGHVAYVCNPKASCSHPQWTHPHPALSPGMNYVLFNSDATGIGQVYLAELSPSFLENIRKGHDLPLQAL